MKTTIWTKSYWLSFLERVLATLAQVLLGFGTAFMQNGFTFEGWDWKNTLYGIIYTSVLAALKGVLANLATKDGPSLFHTEKVTPPLPAPPDA